MILNFPVHSAIAEAFSSLRKQGREKKSSLFYERYMFVISHTDGFIMNYNLPNRRIPVGGTVHGEKGKAKGGR